MSKGKVFLVGAGPGDPGLLTLKGMECLKKADVVVYDRLASPRILQYASGGAELVNVGKRPDRHTMRQEEINALLVRKAREGKVVVRLKGGDPFIFGRGGEEAEILCEQGIDFEVVPGITSAVAVPAYAGIPLTHRKYASSVGIVTGHEDPGKASSALNWEGLATATDTLVFLMGMENLPKIVAQLTAHGRDPKTPVAVIRWGTRAEQETVTATLDTIIEEVEKKGVGSPAIILVGEVVKLRSCLTWFEKKPLFGYRVLVTRSRAQASVLSELIEELGGEPWEFPVIKTSPPADWAPLDQAIRRIKDYRWVFLTSSNGVEAFFNRLYRQGLDARHLAGVKVCAIGPATAWALRERGIQVDFVPDQYRAEGILAGLDGELEPGDRVLLARADIAREALATGLRRMGVLVEEVDAYRTEMDRGDVATVREMLKSGRIGVVTFTSSSTVSNFVELLGREEVPALLGDVIVACIGPVTAGRARDLGIEVNVEAGEYTIPGLVEAIVRYVTRQRDHH